jgi:hypothetical protein
MVHFIHPFMHKSTIPAKVSLRRLLQTSKPQVPLVAAISLLDKPPNRFERECRQSLTGSPSFYQGTLQQVGWYLQIHQKIRMRPSAAVLWLARGKGQCLFQQFNVQIQQKRAVKQQALLPPPLRVSRELQPANRQVRMAFFFHWRAQQCGQGFQVASKDMFVRPGDALQSMVPVTLQDQRIVETPGAL